MPSRKAILGLLNLIECGYVERFAERLTQVCDDKTLLDDKNYISKDDLLSVLFNVAVNNDRQEMVELLIKNGADVNKVNVETGDAPLHVAARLGSREIIDLLIEHGANSFVLNGDGLTPLEVAKARLKSLPKWLDTKNPGDYWTNPRGWRYELILDLLEKSMIKEIDIPIPEVTGVEEAPTPPPTPTSSPVDIYGVTYNKGIYRFFYFAAKPDSDTQQQSVKPRSLSHPPRLQNNAILVT